jgi:hypothetical protein
MVERLLVQLQRCEYVKVAHASFIAKALDKMRVENKDAWRWVVE